MTSAVVLPHPPHLVTQSPEEKSWRSPLNRLFGWLLSTVKVESQRVLGFPSQYYSPQLLTGSSGLASHLVINCLFSQQLFIVPFQCITPCPRMQGTGQTKQRWLLPSPGRFRPHAPPCVTRLSRRVWAATTTLVIKYHERSLFPIVHIQQIWGGS